MNIAIVGTISSSFFGFRFDLIKSLVDSGHSVYLFACDFSDDDVAKFKLIGVTAINYPISRSGLNFFSDFKAMISLCYQFKRLSIDSVLCFFVKPVIYGILASYFARVPRRVALIEGLGSSFTQYSSRISLKRFFVKVIQIFLYKISLPLSNSVVVLNSDDESEIRNICSSCSLHVLTGIGVDLSLFSYREIDLSTPSINFLFVGRLIREKGIFEFVQAAVYLYRIYGSKVSFTVVGSLDSGNLSSLARSDYDLLDRYSFIHFIGEVDDVIPFYERCNVFVLPSYREGMPRSIQEAMAIGRPIITSDVPGCRESIVSGVNGFLIPAHSWSSLAAAMIRYIEEPELSVRMGSASRELAIKFYDSRSANAFLYKLLVETL